MNLYDKLALFCSALQYFLSKVSRQKVYEINKLSGYKGHCTVAVSSEAQSCVYQQPWCSCACCSCACTRTHGCSW